MSKAKAPETTTEALADMVDSASHLDARGRLITVNRLSALQFYRLTKVMGAASSNVASMDLAAIASAVKKIDAAPVAFPSNEREVEFLIQQLDFDGLAAAGEALGKLNEQEAAGVEAAKN